MERKLVRRVLAGVALVLAAAGTWSAFHWTDLRVKYAAHRMATAADDAERARWAENLLALGDAGVPVLVGRVQAGDPQQRAAAGGVLDRYLNSLPDGDPRAVALCGRFLDAFAGCDDGGRAAVLDLLPVILKRAGWAHAGKYREVVAAGLQMPSPAGRVAAVRLAMHPQVRMRADVLPLLNAAETEVRQAALFAVGPATDDDPVIGDEELFRWLNDPDGSVRAECHAALVSRGRSEAEIAMGRRLAHPDAGERLKLLLDLRYDDDVPDPEPWLERLSRDSDPGVRAGSARVAVELAVARLLPTPVWVGRLADSDTDPTVRRIARYYRSLPITRKAEDGVRGAGAP